MPADARVEKNSLGADGRFDERSMRDTANANIQMYGPDYVDPVQFRQPVAFIYVWSIVDPRPVGSKLHRRFPPLLSHVEIAELNPDDGEKYKLVCRLPNPMNQYCMRENGERYMDSHDARRLAMDIVNPDNLTLNQDFKLDPSRIFSIGNDYGRLGVFWTTTDKPTSDDLTKAIRRKEEYYRARLQEARKLEMTNPKMLYEYLGINDHVAADYFQEEYSWHRRPERPAYCPNCGEAMKPGAAFHAMQAVPGTVCVIDWRLAVKAGVKTHEDVPEECRWWKEPDGPRRGRPPKASREEEPEEG